MEQGDVFVISAPSGSGKTTICRYLLQRVEGLELSISYTTRPRKPGETDGKDYFFINEEKFDSMLILKEFLEYASVYGNRYGTSRAGVRSIVSRGVDAVLEIDVQGGAKVKETLPEAILVGIFPPDWETLARRLTGRGRDSREEMETRLEAAGREMRELLAYDYLLVNDDLEKAVTQAEWIVRAHRLRRERVRARMEKILNR
ncbi:MAG: guanylate kinase [Deltaproteobacteria bacterium RBG_19FT_COMBO_60_16]|nr:MAG: guanylate kinase [Deltaproteobacteria bacterium RBG_16_64_85]OGP99684.1 MAG: guanylate kinase [Deltaproteobacteria bacterium RBG_19FT_COMBO_60_16]